MKASELIEKLEKAIAKVGDVDIKGVKTDDYSGGVEHLYNFKYLCVTDKGNIILFLQIYNKNHHNLKILK